MTMTTHAGRTVLGLILATASLVALAQGPALDDTPPPPPQTSVSEIRSDPTLGREIRLRGQLVRQMGDGVHLLTDHSGSIPVDVNHTALKVDRSVQEPAEVEIVGELVGPTDAPPTVRARSVTVVAPEPPAAE